MESSHRRTLQEAEERHERELLFLRQEKEEALEEETRATLAALDAMRKAHEAEVQREVAKLKEELLRKGDDSGGEAHMEEVHELRREIFTLSEKYSVKCLQVTQREEQLATLRKQMLAVKDNSKKLEESNIKLESKISSQVASQQVILKFRFLKLFLIICFH